MNENKTLEYYNKNADNFAKTTIDVNFYETQKHFQELLPEHGYILDFGCGSGRDTKYFLEQGFYVDATDGSEEMCHIASNYTVVILFNYQPDYKNVYQTWLNVYSSFEAKIVYSPRNLNNESQMFDGGKVADNIAAIIAGNTGVIDFSKQIEVTQFDNLTEFAGYIAKKFEQAESLRKEDNYAHSALYYMDEQFYAANSDVNDILKIYFPEQFGERAFLDYPIGHFFLSITNMWDPESKILCLKDFNDLYECLSCRIICEERHGELISILDRIRLFIDKETTIKCKCNTAT